MGHGLLWLQRVGFVVLWQVGLNPRPLSWKVGTLPLEHQGSLSHTNFLKQQKI